MFIAGDMWFSSDGDAWHRSTKPPQVVGDVAADDAGFVAVGPDNPAVCCVINEQEDLGVTSASLDGDVWREMPRRGWRGREVEVLAIDGRTLVGVGADYHDPGDANDYAAVWTAPLP